MRRRRRRTHYFEQVPLDIVRKIVERKIPAEETRGIDTVVLKTRAPKTEPYGAASCSQQRRELGNGTIFKDPA